MTENEKMLNRLAESNRKCIRRLRKDKLETTKLLMNIRDLCDYPTEEVVKLIKNRINYHLNTNQGAKHAQALCEEFKRGSKAENDQT